MHRIVVIKVNQLGDAVTNLPVIEALVHKLGRDNVGIITTPIADELYSLLIPENNRLVMMRDHFNDSWRNPFRLFAIWKWLCQFRPDSIMIPRDQGSVARLLARVGWRTRVIEMQNPHVKLPTFCATSLLMDINISMHQNNWDLYKFFASQHNLGTISNTPPRPTTAWGIELPVERKSPIVLIHSGSSREATRWGHEHFEQLSNLLLDAGIEVFWMEESAHPPPRAGLTILGRRNLQEFARIALQCSLFIGNNSGPMHVCDSLDIPLLVLCGPVGREWDPYWSSKKFLVRFPELACQPCEVGGYMVVKCPRQDEPYACMNRATVLSVFQKAMKMLTQQNALR